MASGLECATLELSSGDYINTTTILPSKGGDLVNWIALSTAKGERLSLGNLDKTLKPQRTTFSKSANMFHGFVSQTGYFNDLNKLGVVEYDYRCYQSFVQAVKQAEAEKAAGSATVVTDESETAVAPSDTSQPGEVTPLEG